MENKLITYLPLFGIVITIGLLSYNFIKTPSNKPGEETLENVIKNISNTNPSNDLESKGNKAMDKTNMEKPSQIINLNSTYTAIMNTSKGEIKIKLYNKEAPLTVNNFVYLAKNNFYNGLKFHRIIKDFMIQGGDPLGNGTGGPGYKFNDEFSNKKLVKGSIAMANSGPNTNGSQFFIVSAKETPWLDGRHTNFGEVISGIEIVDAIENVTTDYNDKPLEDVIINSIEIIEE